MLNFKRDHSVIGMPDHYTDNTIRGRYDVAQLSRLHSYFAVCPSTQKTQSEITDVGSERRPLTLSVLNPTQKCCKGSGQGFRRSQNPEY